jgi:hypothetical protein
MLRDIGNGLIMRRSMPTDADALAEFNARLHSDDAADGRMICFQEITQPLAQTISPSLRNLPAGKSYLQ